jgi:uncharacterized membrane protein YeaQ/YmgE (transglycosylase-associated protein family)
MEILVWLFTGGLVGWVTYSLLGYNRGRSLGAVVAIGAAGALVGGKVLAPLVLDASIADDFAGSALFFVAGVAAVFLLVGNLLHQRWGV